uniref:F-box domain-containing protein n=1 Tax=Leersia perrieri TaxID=77586 RepID=A0A0D9X016_9ORYZ
MEIVTRGDRDGRGAVDGGLGRVPVSAAAGDGVDLISDLPDALLELILSFLPAIDAVRSSVLSRRWRRVWTRAYALNLSDEQHQGRFLAIAGAVLKGYAKPDIPSLNVAITHPSNLGQDTAWWLLDAMERAVCSLSVMVTGPCTMDRFVLPATVRAKAVSLQLSNHFARHGVLVLPEPKEATDFTRLMELSLSKLRAPPNLGEFLSRCCPQLRKLRLSSGKPAMWPLVLDMDMLKELEVNAIQTLSSLEVSATNLQSLAVH